MTILAQCAAPQTIFPSPLRMDCFKLLPSKLMPCFFNLQFHFSKNKEFTQKFSFEFDLSFQTLETNFEKSKGSDGEHCILSFFDLLFNFMLPKSFVLLFA